jgi:membrane protein DedA with SNARE-associated domain
MDVIGLSVFLAACLHEDVAILMAAYFVVERGMSPVAAGLLAYAGMLANNLALYGVGAYARRHPRLQRWLTNRHAIVIRHRLERHLVLTLALSRLGQSMLTPALLGCGFLRIPLQRVLPVVALTAAIYLSALLTLVIALGERVMQHVGQWAWILPLALIALVTWVMARRRSAPR